VQGHLCLCGVKVRGQQLPHHHAGQTGEGHAPAGWVMDMGMSARMVREREVEQLWGEKEQER
jgi:hypothetical protein